MLTYIWSIQKEFSMGLKVRPEEDPRCHGPGRAFVWVQDSLLRNSIGQEKNHHDQKKINQVHSLRNQKTEKMFCKVRMVNALTRITRINTIKQISKQQ